MNTFLRKVLIFSALLTLPLFANAAGSTYTLLAPMGPLSGSVTLSEYLDKLMMVIIGVAGILAVVMIVICGIQMMGSPSVSQKTASKECITNAILGLLLAVGSWVILNTINTDLLKSDATLASLPTPTAVVGGPSTESNPVSPGCYFKYTEIATGRTKFSRNSTCEMCELLRSDFQTKPAAYTIVSTCFEIEYGKAAPAIVAGQAPPASTVSGSVTCPQSGMNLCEPYTHACSNASCAQFTTWANTYASGAVTAQLIMAIIVQESSCISNASQAYGFDGKSGGPIHLTPATANKFRGECNVTDPITVGWLANKKNWEAGVCMGAKYLQSLTSTPCGSDIRNIAAGYNGGSGVCGAGTSNDCLPPDKNCAGTGVQMWECLYADTAHKTCDTGYRNTRQYAVNVLYCATKNPSPYPL